MNLLLIAGWLQILFRTKKIQLRVIGNGFISSIYLSILFFFSFFLSFDGDLGLTSWSTESWVSLAVVATAVAAGHSFSSALALNPNRNCFSLGCQFTCCLADAIDQCQSSTVVKVVIARVFHLNFRSSEFFFSLKLIFIQFSLIVLCNWDF